jgi:hypothetical protein
MWKVLLPNYERAARRPSSGFGCRTLVVFKGADSPIINRIFPIDESLPRPSKLAPSSALFSGRIYDFGCRTFVVFNGADFPILNSIFPTNEFLSQPSKLAPVAEIVKSWYPASKPSPAPAALPHSR